MINPIRPRPVYIAALSREISALVKGWHTDPSLLKNGVHLYWNDHAIIGCAGMGATRAARAVEAALNLGPAAQLVSIGWAGACNPKLKVGDILQPSTVVDARTGERFFTDMSAKQFGTGTVLVTVPTQASTKEKARLQASYQSSAVDMEAAAVGRIARAREVPFTAIKAISDESDFELPDMTKFTTARGQLKEVSFGLHIAVRPALWRPVMELGKGSKLAAERLHFAVEEHMRGS